MKVLIFGSNGQDGHYLTSLLTSLGVEVVRVSRKNSNFNGDIACFDFVHGLIDKIRPDYIFHFAANSTVSHEAIFENDNAISKGTINILESVYRLDKKIKVFLSGSAMQFLNRGVPIDENGEFEASSPYSASRIYSTYLGRYYREKLGLKVYVGYFFNHDSPLRSIRHFNKKVIDGIRRIKLGEIDKLELGDLSIKKEFNFAGDIVKAVWLLVNQEKYFEAVIGSGTLNSLEDWVKYCFSKFDLDYKNYVNTDVSIFKNDYRALSCNPSRILEIGWKPDYDLKKLADLMIEELA